MFNKNKTKLCITVILLLIGYGIGFTSAKLFSGYEINTSVIRITDSAVSALGNSLVYVIGVRG